MNQSKVQESCFKNGLKSVHRQIDSELMYLGFVVKVGTRHENRLQYGLAHFIEHLLFKGTLNRNSRQIIQEIEAVGGEMNAYTSKEETTIYCITPKKYFLNALDLLIDIVQNSQFPEQEIEKERGVIVDEIYSYEDSPSELIFDEFENLLFKGHALGHNILGSEQSVRRFTQKDCLRFYKEFYRLEQMVFFSQGGLATDEVEQALCQTLQTDKLEHSSPVPQVKRLSKLWKREVCSVLRRKKTCQSHVLYGGLAYPQDDERRLALSLLVNIFGGPSMNSRLNLLLREEHGLVYHVDCCYTSYSDTGFVGVYFACSKKEEETVLKLVNEELGRFVNEGLSLEDLESAQKQMIGQLSIGAENRENIFLSMGKNYLHEQKVESLETLKQNILNLKLEDLQFIIKEVFDQKRFSRLVFH